MKKHYRHKWWRLATHSDRKDITDMTNGGWPAPSNRKDVKDMSGEGWPAPSNRKDITVMPGGG